MGNFNEKKIKKITKQGKGSAFCLTFSIHYVWDWTHVGVIKFQMKKKLEYCSTVIIKRLKVP